MILISKEELEMINVKNNINMKKPKVFSYGILKTESLSNIATLRRHK